MKLATLLAFTLVVLSMLSCEDRDNNPNDLIINEFLAINETCYSDEYGEYDDWVEIFNNSTDTLDIGGMYISDKVNDSNPYMIPNSFPEITSILPNGYILIWCDRDVDQGPLHVDFKLSGNGESIILLDRDRLTVIDGYTFGAQTVDISMGRVGNDWVSLEVPSPGQSNEN